MTDCGSLANPENGAVEASSGTTVGNTAMYSCDAGYDLKGPSTRTCGTDGMWTLTVPICTRKLNLPIRQEDMGRGSSDMSNTVTSSMNVMFASDIHCTRHMHALFKKIL